MDEWGLDDVIYSDDDEVYGSYLFNRTLQLIEKYHSDGGPTCWHHLVRSVTLMASDPKVSIYEKMECLKENGNNIEVDANIIDTI